MTFIHKKTFNHKKHSFKEDASLAYLALFNQEEASFHYQALYALRTGYNGDASSFKVIQYGGALDEMNAN